MNVFTSLLRVNRLPLMSRRNYLLEVRHLLLWGMFVGMFEGTVSSIVASKTFHAGPWLIALITSTPMLANLLGGVWGAVITGRPKIRLLLGFGLASAAVIASVSLTPREGFGGYIFALQILLARIFLAGCVSIRAALWKHNYPTRMRGQIAARLQIVRFSMAVGTVMLAATLFDERPELYVWIYPTAALLGGIGLMFMRPMRVRGERTEIARIRRRRSAAPAIRENLWSASLRDGFNVLREDADYRRYCIGMSFLGFSNMMVIPLMVVIITKEMSLNYTASCGLLEVLPQILMMLSLLPWARLFDAGGVVRFRVRNAMVWGAASLFAGIGVAALRTEWYGTTAGFVFVIVCISISRIWEGLGRGGGAIAWNLGHLDFAEPERAEAYMGIHVFLTGLRGITAPFFGTWLYHQSGAFTFAVSVALATGAVFVFRGLLKGQERRVSATDDSPPAGVLRKGAAVPAPCRTERRSEISIRGLR